MWSTCDNRERQFAPSLLVEDGGACFTCALYRFKLPGDLQLCQVAYLDDGVELIKEHEDGRGPSTQTQTFMS